MNLVHRGKYTMHYIAPDRNKKRMSPRSTVPRFISIAGNQGRWSPIRYELLLPSHAETSICNRGFRMNVWDSPSMWLDQILGQWGMCVGMWKGNVLILRWWIITVVVQWIVAIQPFDKPSITQHCYKQTTGYWWWKKKRNQRTSIVFAR